MTSTRLPAGPDAYGETFQDDLAVVRTLIAKVAGLPWETWHEAFAAASFGKLKSQRGDDVRQRAAGAGERAARASEIR